MENEAMTWIILAGGHSRRMGQPKDQLPWGSGTLLSAAVEKAARSGARQILVSHNAPCPPYCCCPDLYPDMGPLGGIHACLHKAEQDFSMVVPVDVPLFPEELAAEMVRHARETGTAYLSLCWNGRLEPAVAVIHRSALAAIDAMLIRGERKLRALSRYVPSGSFVREGNPELLLNCNSPRDYETLLSLPSVR